MPDRREREIVCVYRRGLSEREREDCGREREKYFDALHSNPSKSFRADCVFLRKLKSGACTIKLYRSVIKYIFHYAILFLNDFSKKAYP